MTAAEFFDWWRTQLSELVPATLRGSWHSAQTTVAVDIGGGKVELSASPAKTTTAIDLHANDEEAQKTLAQSFLAQLPGVPQRIRITLPPDEYLVQRLSLPRAAQGHLNEAVGYQLPQLTPFAADQLLYACGEVPGSAPDGQISVWLVAIPRQRISRALALIGQLPPDGPLPLRAPPPPDERLVVSWPIRETETSPRRRVRLAWAGLAVLWVAVLGIHLNNRQQTQETLDLTRDGLRARAIEVSRLRDRLDSTESQMSWLSQRRQERVSLLMLLDTLTRQLDDQTWLQGLELRGRRLNLRGISSSPATLLETLEASELLRNVRFEAAITRDGRGQGDRFNISARLEAPVQDGGT